VNILRTVSIPLLVVAALAPSACSTEISRAPSPNTGEAQSPIINGKEDATHVSVVALLQQGSGNEGSACTATIIKTDVNKKIGYALTAAHCVEGINGGVPSASNFFVVEGKDYNAQSSSVVYYVTDFKKNPSYGGDAGDPYDFAIVKFTGADADTAVTPYATKALDTLKQGQSVDLLGYGKTSDTDTTNSIRHIITKPIDSLDALYIGFNQTNGGLCQGDSGGPVLAKLGGKDYVVGVNSFVSSDSGTCLQGGFAGRVSAAQAWIDGYISGAGGTDVPTCDECQTGASSGKGACVTQSQACGQSDACVQYNDCLGGCKDQACYTACGTSNAAGKKVFDAYSDCVLTECKAECSSACGFTFDDSTDGGAANTCFESKCCSQGSDCAGDATCTACLGSNPPAAATCQGNAKFKALSTCISKSCADEFGGAAKCGFTFDTSQDGGASNKCFEGSCCSEGQACADDATCDDCLSNADADPDTCGKNSAYTGLVGCLRDSCADEFGLAGAGGAPSTGKGGSSGTGGTGGTSSSNGGSDGEGDGGTDASGGKDGVSIGNGSPAGSGNSSSGGCAVAETGANAPSGIAGLLLAVGALFAGRTRRRTASR
jgi:MYXO-CTERM domain-containing protein